MTARSEFFYTEAPISHHVRARQILARHPEIRSLIGRRNPATFWIALGCVVMQFTLAWMSRDASWFQVLGLAYVVGAFPSHALFVVVHEATHHLIFRGATRNLLTAVMANLPLVLPTALTFRVYHLKHHSFMGVEELDADTPSRWEARLIRGYAPAKAFWLFMFPLFQALRTLRVRDAAVFDRWTMLNYAAQVLATGLVYWCMGPMSFLYLFASFWFSISLHPLGARWIQEHWLTLDEEQETYSYYGPFNWLQMNIGYHYEHHDFPAVPWNLLPEVKRMAPEFYDGLKCHKSWTGLLFLFLFERELTLWHRMTRPRHGPPQESQTATD